MGNAHTVAVANTHGHLNLQAFKPVMVYNIIDSITLLTEASSSFQSHCVAGIEADRDRIAEHLQQNLMLVTALNSKIGYDKAAKVAKTAFAENKTLKQISVEELGYLTADEFDRYDPECEHIIEA